MKILNNVKLISVSMLFILGISACDKPGPAETAGKNIDETMEAAGDKIGETADKIGDKMSAQGDKVGVAIDDAEITTRVKAAVFAMPGLDTLQISVDTVKGVVTLSGLVDSQADHDMAASLAQEVEGVHQVDNKLAIK
ncbi:MAG: BON domain-containing protein [Gammaproteobacteria bacterium]|nr:BON domain-containing protein [Gammaproteobacteria bacterium]